MAEKATAAPQLAVRLASLRTTMATKVPPRVLLPTLTKCYSKMVNSKQVGGELPRMACDM